MKHRAVFGRVRREHSNQSGTRPLEGGRLAHSRGGMSSRCARRARNGSSLSTNCIRACRDGPAGYRRRRAGVKARRGHHTSRADVALAWCVSKFRGANAFNHASGPYSMARVVRRHHIKVIGVSAPEEICGADTRCSLLSRSHFSQNRPRVLKKSLKAHQ